MNGEEFSTDIPAIDSARDLTHHDLIVQFGRPPNRIDLISSLGSVDFASAWSRRVVERITADSAELPIYIISLPDLIQSKKDAGRHKDLDGNEHLLDIDEE